MAYSGRAEQICHRALLNAFDRATVEQFVVVHLGTEFENVTRRGNFSDEMWDLVRWADREEGRLLTMMRRAAAEVPDNAHLKEALKHLDSPAYVESRWYAKYVPLTTWLVWMINTWLIVAAFTVWLVNLLDVTRILFFATLAAIVGCLGWLLYQRLVGGPVRSFAGFLLLQRLIAHSRLGARDWLAFAGSLAVAALLTVAVRAAPSPVRVSFERDNIQTIWTDSEFTVLGSFLTSPTMETQNDVSAAVHERDRFSPTYYRIDIYTGASNAPQEVNVQIDIIHPDAVDADDLRAGLPVGVSFADVAFDRELAAVLDDRLVRAETAGHLRASDRNITFTLPLERLKGHHTVLFTCQRALDAQPNASEVAVYVQLKSEDDAVLSRARGGSRISEWGDRVALHLRGSSRGLVSVAAAGRSADRRPFATLDLLLRLPGTYRSDSIAARSGRS